MRNKNQDDHDSQDQDQPSVLTHLVAIAIELFGGVAMLPTPAALKLAGWPGTSDEAICLARREKRLPVAERKYGSRFYVTAGAFAEAFLTGSHDPTPPAGAASVQPARRGRGRPHKYMPSEDAA